jgi:hypothetical protein
MHPGSGRNVQDPIGHEDSSAGLARGCKVRVEPGIHHQPSRRCGFGATRRRMDGAAGGCEIRGNSETHQPVALTERGFGATRRLTVGTARGCRIRGNPKTYRRRRWRSEDSGQPGDSPPVPPKDARFEETRRSIAGTAGRCRIRGNSEPHSKAERVDAWSE